MSLVTSIHNFAFSLTTEWIVTELEGSKNATSITKFVYCDGSVNIYDCSYLIGCLIVHFSATAQRFLLKLDRRQVAIRQQAWHVVLSARYKVL